MTGTRALLRLAWRDARRDRWRSVLVVALVALPVALLGGAITTFDTMASTPQERVTEAMGNADAAVAPAGQLEPGVDFLARVAALLPDGTVLEQRWSTGLELVRPGERLFVAVTDASVEPDALGVGRYRVLDGQGPTTSQQVAITEASAENLGVVVGDVLTLDPRGDVEVVGIVRRPEWLDEQTLLVAPGSLTADELVDAYPEVLIGLPEGADDEALDALFAFDEEGLTDEFWGLERDSILATRFSGGERWIAVVAGGLAAVEVALIVGAAFAVSVRRRQRELGLLAAVGGTMTHVRRAVVFTGLAAGVVGVAIGTIVGVLGSIAAFPWLEGIAAREITILRLDPRWLALVAGLGLASALIGAWWPARSVARLPVTVALSGRRPPSEPSVRGLRWGVAVIAVGIATLGAASFSYGIGPYIFLLGSVLLVLGAGLTSPWLLEQLGRLAPRLPAGPRLALRDAARFRTRNGPIVTAAMAGLAASITIASLVGSAQAHEARSYNPSLATDQVVVYGSNAEVAAREIARRTGGEYATVEYLPVGVSVAGGADGETAWLDGTAALGTDELAALLGGEAAIAALARGEVVLLGQEFERVSISSNAGGDDGQTAQTFTATSLPGPLGFETDTQSSTRHSQPTRYTQYPTVLVPQELVPDLEPFETDTALVRVPTPMDEGLREVVVAAAASVPGEPFVETEQGYTNTYATMMAVVLAVGALSGLIVVGVAIALASAEARADLRTLTAIGASRSTRRSLAAGRALLLSTLGGVLAIPVGLVPGAAVVLRATVLPFTVPWLAIAIVAIGVPLVATLAAVLASSRSPGLDVRTG